MVFDQRSILVVAAGYAGEARAAIEGMGARLIGPVAPEAFAETGAADLLLIEAAGLGDDALAAMLERATRVSVPVVVAFTPDQLDLVAAYLLTGAAQLLCAPTLAERITALALALGGSSGRLREGGGEEQRRIARLHAEIARLADAIARLTRGDDDPTPPDVLGDRRPIFTLERPRTNSVAAEVRALLRARRLREADFGAALFEDPAWDMLLDLFAAEQEGVQVSVSSLCIAAAVAPTTALRWISRMTQQGLFERVPDPDDGRRAFMVLSRETAAAMARHWQARRALLAGGYRAS